MVMELNKTPERILVLKPSAIGDIANALPFLEGIRRRFPSSKIGWLINQSYTQLLAKHEAIHELFPFDRNSWKNGIFKGIRSFSSLIGKIRSFRPDISIDLQCLLRTGIISRLSGAPIRIGLEDCREGSRAFYTHIVPYPNPGNMHSVERYWEAAKFLGCEGKAPNGSFPRTYDSSLQSALENLPRPWVGCCPGARWRTKQWKLEYFCELLSKAINITKGSVILFGGPDDVESATKIQNALSNNIPLSNLVGKTSLSGLVDLISSLDFTFSNDTGPLHIAVAQGIPVISPFLCTKVAWNGPYGQFDNALETSVPCKASYLMKCDRMICQDDLTPSKFHPIVERICEPWKKP